MITAPERASQHYEGFFSDQNRWNAFTPRKDDIVVITPPKSGTTWTQGILAMLISGDPEVNAETSMRSPWIDINVRDVSEVMARLEAQTHRRQVKTHTPFDGIPVWPDLRYVSVYRHPIDVHFSLRKHAANQIPEISRKFFPAAFFDDDVGPGFELFVDGEFHEAASLHAIVTHYKSALARDMCENTLRLHYADMLRDLPGTFDRIAAHVGISHPPDLMARMVEAARFDNMKANAHRFTPSAGQGVWADDAGFFDSASSNKWEGRVSPDHLARYDSRIAQMLSPEERHWLEWGSVAT